MEQGTKDEEFDKIFKRYGGRFKIEEIVPGFQPLLMFFNRRTLDYLKTIHLLSHRLKKPIPNIYFDYINNYRFNAAVSRTNDGDYFIGINVGSMLILNDLFLRILANSKLMPHIGDCSLETNSGPTVKHYYFDASQLYSQWDYQGIAPKDEIRLAYAIHLTEFAVDFLVTHELAHILHGHLDCIIGSLQMNVFEELASSGIKIDDMTKQTLEMDADSSGTTGGLANSIARHLGKQTVSENRISFYADLNNTVFNWGFAIMTLVRIMVEYHIYNPIDPDAQDHPHPRARQTMIMANVDSYLAHFHPELYKSFDRGILKKTIVSAEEAYESITGNYTDRKLWEKEIQSSRQYVPTILQHWKLIRPTFNPYSFLELPD